MGRGLCCGPVAGRGGERRARPVVARRGRGAPKSRKGSGSSRKQEDRDGSAGEKPSPGGDPAGRKDLQGGDLIFP